MALTSYAPITLSAIQSEFSAGSLASASTAAGLDPLPTSMLDFLGLSAYVISLADIPNQYAYGLYDDYDGGQSIDVFVGFLPNGTWYASGPNSSGNWYSPTTPGIGAYFWIRFTQTSWGYNQGSSASPSTGWLNLASYGDSLNQPYMNASTRFGGLRTAVYTIEISTDPWGNNIVATRTGYTLQIDVQ